MTDIILITKRILLTVVLTGLIGAERQMSHKGAGLRTHILVGVGSALITLTSLYLFDIFNQDSAIDPSRMIAGIVTGIGFLCAGTIIRGGTSIMGLTTAASMWTASGIGIAVGVGYGSGAIVVSVVVFIVLTALRTFDTKLERRFGRLP